MIKTSIEKLAEDIGMDIAHSDDQVQANLINGLCEGLANGMDKHKLDTQICYVVDKLSIKTCEVLAIISEFIKLKNGDLK